jgi:hypothetical protein
MTHDDRDEDARLSRLLAAVRADAEPALWTRVRARIEARERDRGPAWLAWLERPVALGASFALLAAAVATSLTLVAGAPRVPPAAAPASADDLADALVAELDPGAASAPAGGGADSGAVR